MAKMIELNTPDGPDYIFFCPGCKNYHGVWVTRKHPTNLSKWSFNGDLDKPTITPSIVVKAAQYGKFVRCHSFVTEGKIKFLNDCTHELAGQTVDLKDED